VFYAFYGAIAKVALANRAISRRLGAGTILRLLSTAGQAEPIQPDSTRSGQFECSRSRSMVVLIGLVLAYFYPLQRSSR
jgi:hypothetical protein